MRQFQLTVQLVIREVSQSILKDNAICRVVTRLISPCVLIYTKSQINNVAD